MKLERMEGNANITFALPFAQRVKRMRQNFEWLANRRVVVYRARPQVGASIAGTFFENTEQTEITEHTEVFPFFFSVCSIGSSKYPPGTLVGGTR